MIVIGDMEHTAAVLEAANTPMENIAEAIECMKRTVVIRKSMGSNLHVEA